MAFDLPFEDILKRNEVEDCNYLGVGWLKVSLAQFLVAVAGSGVKCRGTIEKRIAEQVFVLFYRR
ncbi:hypothetical protein, partial [Actinobacillus pleuropneumoniae]|uniref:hypothetical protein n=1 Tax=Actinobacillus pleuropneumoniae TaxID=715 RepID=UPI00227B1737